MEVGCQLHAPATLSRGETGLSTQWIVDWVDPGDGLDNMKKQKILTLSRFELQLLGHPACR
jgi:hypothetical protein